ncbi:hypothetical protein [Hyphomonas sp. BRH_c22]|uniref:hypothetical protein n=1 Tax=Hyphomonas sp. BRH_c22 TaxID=1629710 RepID=UPI0005F26ED7|nr:hypothetical protein [Hyphomonas sp. BRH_c22]
MTKRLNLWLALIMAAFLAACATAPTGMGPAFDAALVEASSGGNPYAADDALSKLLENTSLSDDERVRALYARGSLRRQAGDDRKGAVEDFGAMLKLAPEHPLASNAREELAFAQTDVETIEAGLARPLNLSQWFNSMWVLGAHAEAAERYRKSGLSPSETELAKLVADGFVCDDKGGEAPVYTLGDMRPDLEHKHWCAPPDA